jgi:hypothetical protein
MVFKPFILFSSFKTTHLNIKKKNFPKTSIKQHTPWCAPCYAFSSDIKSQHTRYKSWLICIDLQYSSCCWATPTGYMNALGSRDTKRTSWRFVRLMCWRHGIVTKKFGKNLRRFFPLAITMALFANFDFSLALFNFSKLGSGFRMRMLAMWWFGFGSRGGSPDTVLIPFDLSYGPFVCGILKARGPVAGKESNELEGT